jgi:two-component system sensor histidine kinase CiaH
MIILERRVSPNFLHAARVAAAATLLIAMVYVAFAVIFDVVDSHHLVAQVDAHLSERLSAIEYRGELLGPPKKVDDDHDIDGPPVVLWRVDVKGRATALSDYAPALPAGSWSRSGGPTTATIGSTPFRLEAIRSSGHWLVGGQSLSDTQHVENVLVAAEVIAGPVLVVAMFLGALLIGLKASGPVEQARLRQLEFTADASHELRTPLSVIEAEVGLALRSPRNAPSYRDALERVGRESGRLRHIVEDLLWLSRFDSEPPPPADEPVDVAVIAQSCADRFLAVARSREIELSVRSEGEGPSWIKAPPEWIDRLTGVLVDNACRYAGEGGSVAVVVSSRGNRVSLVVEDSGPGIPPEERTKLFDRFHRATDQGGGAGLGLAIADVVVRSTGGRWSVADASHGGAHFEVTWHRFGPRESGSDPSGRPKNSKAIVKGGSEAPDTEDRETAGLAQRIW